MPPVDTIIKNAQLVLTGRIIRGGVAIDDGKIIAVTTDSKLPKADNIINANGNLLMPGLIDAHVHFRDPGNTYREDFESGTKAAAAGGVTTVLDMPTTVPPVTSAELLEAKRRIVEKKAIVDFGLYGAASAENLDKIHELAEAGVIAFKTHMVAPAGQVAEEFKGVYVKDAANLLTVFEVVKKTGRLECLHAEDHSLVHHSAQKLRDEGRLDPSAHCEGRPSVAEVTAIATAIAIAGSVGIGIRIAHLSTKVGLDYVRVARKAGISVSVEVSPHHLLLTASQMKKLGPYAKMNPPLRTEKDRLALWKGIQDGTIDTIATDHAPHSLEEKERGWRNIWEANSGVPGVETMLPLLLTKVNEGKMSIGQLAKLTSENVARIFGIYPRKGAIQVGSDADLVIVDLKRKETIKAEESYTKAKNCSVYNRWRIRGVPILTILRGKVVMKDGIVSGRAGEGNFISPLTRKAHAKRIKT